MRCWRSNARGHGYIAEQGMEQFVRDARIAMIYEGANGIQALDLVGLELPRDGGRAVMAFFSEVANFAEGARRGRGDEARHPAPLSTALGHLQQATTWLMQNAMMKPDNAVPPQPITCNCSGSWPLPTCGRAWPK